jgi:hypothetical protein
MTFRTLPRLGGDRPPARLASRPIPWLLGALVLCAGLALPAAEPAAVAAALASPADATRYPQAGAVVLLDETVVTLDAQGRATREGHRLIKILQDRAMRQLSDQKIPFRGDTEACDVLVARTLLPGGGSQTPEANGIMEVSDPEAAAAPFYSSARLKVVSFPAVQIGAVLELRYRVHPLAGKQPAQEPDPFSGDQLFGGAEPVRAGSLTLAVPAGTPLRYQMFNGAPEPAVVQSEAGARYTWTVRDQPQLVPEAGMVPEEAILPRVVWTVVQSRQDLGRWLANQFQAVAGADPAVAAKARSLTAGRSGTEAKVERLALFVTREIQTVPLGLGRVGYRTTPAAAILANRYADCRDKYVLFQALLRAVGVVARPVFIRQVRAPISDLACLDEYDDILARVELPSGIRYYNLSRSRSRLGQLVAADALRPGLLASPEGGETLTTPAVDERHQYLRTRWDAALDAAGDLAGRITLDYGGEFDQRIRTLLFGRNQEERRVLFQATVDRIKKGARLEGFQVSDLLDLTAPARITLTLRAPGFACRQGDMMILNLPGDGTPLGESPVQPVLPVIKQPFLVPATFALDTALDLKLPSGYRIAYQPPDTELRQEPFAFTLACAPRGDGLQVRRTLRWRDAVVAPGAYPAVRRAFDQAGGPADTLVLLEKIPAP